MLALLGPESDRLVLPVHVPWAYAPPDALTSVATMACVHDIVKISAYADRVTYLTGYRIGSGTRVGSRTVKAEPRP